MPEGSIVTLPVQVDNLPPGLEPADTTFVYAKYLSANLREKVESYRRAAATLHDEVAMSRMLAGEAAQRYDAVYRSIVSTPDLTESQKTSLMAQAGAYLQSALNYVRDMVLAAHRVTSKEAIDPMVVQQIIFQTVKVFDNTMQLRAAQFAAAGIDVRDIVNEFTNTVDQRVNAGISEAQRLGTTLTSEQLDEEVSEMLDTIPEVA